MIQFSIQNILNEQLQREKQKREIKSWHPSKLGSCLTGAYLERLGVPPDEEFDDRTLRVFSVGKHVEDWFVGLIERSGAKIEKQVRIEIPEFDVTGYADLVIETPAGRMPYEIKSKHSKSFWYMEKKGLGAAIQNRMQLWVYLYCLRLEEGRLLYFSKDDLTIAEYPVFLNDTELAKLVTDELEILNRAWKEKLPPPPIVDEKDWRTRYCRWHKKCLSQERYLEVK